MSLPEKYGVDKKISSMGGLSAYENGGKGSGNFGHSGRPGEVGGSGNGGGGFSKGDEVTFYQYGENHKGRIIRKISEKEKQDRADLNNPDAGDYYEVATGSGDFASKSIVWEGRIKKAEKQSKEKKGSGEISLKGKSLYEKIQMIQPGDEVHIQPKDNLPNFDKKIKVDYIQDGVIHYGASERSDGYTYPDWAIKDIKKIIRKKNELELNGGKGSGNFGHSGRPGEIGGSGKEKTQLQRATEAEATSGKVGHFAGLQYVDEIYKEKSGKMKDDLSRLKEVKDRGGYVDANDPAHNRLDEIKEQLARAKELIGSDAPEAQRTKLKKLEKLVGEIEDITGWKNSIGRTKTFSNGGKGSGNFGHTGRPGLVGGSGDGDAPASEWDEPYKEFTKTDQIGIGDYGEAGFFTTGDFAVDAHLGAKDVVDSVKDYNIINDMIFEAETRDHLAATPEGKRIEGLITDLKGELHAQDVYSSATFETSERRQRILMQTAASVASIRKKLEDARGVDRYDKYIDKAVDIAKKTERRAMEAAKKSYDKWETHKTARPQVAGGTLTAEQDRQVTHAYDKYQIEKQRKRESGLSYAFSR